MDKFQAKRKIPIKWTSLKFQKKCPLHRHLESTRKFSKGLLWASWMIKRSTLIDDFQLEIELAFPVLAA